MPDAPSHIERPTWLQSPERFVGLLGDAGIGVWELDHTTGAFAASDQLLALYGLPTDTPRDEVLSALMACVHPDDIGRVRAESDALFHAGVVAVVDYRVRRVSDRADRWLRARTMPTRLPDGSRGQDVGILRDVTEERQQAEQLDQQRHELGRAQAIAGIGSFTCECATDVTRWSRETYRLLGLDPAVVPASISAFEALLTPEDVPRFRRALEDALAGTAPYDIELAVRRPDGRTVLIHDRAEVERDATGAPVRITGTKQDVTARREAEQERSRQARELARTQRMARLGSWSWYVQSGVVWWSAHVWELFELDNAMPASIEALRTIFPRDQQSIYDEAVHRALEGTLPYEVEVSTRLPSGRELIVRAIGEVERAPDGLPVAIHGAVQDVTEERRRERAVLESEQGFRTLAEAGPVGVFRTGADGHTSYANPRLLQLWGMTLPEFLGGWRNVVHPDDVERVTELGRVAVANGQTFRSEYRIVVRGEERHVRVASSPVLDEGTRYAGQIGIVEDITDEVHVREQAARFEAELRHAQKLESLGVLAGGIAHDFNNLLVGVLTNASLALDALPQGAPVHDLVTNIERAAQRAADLTRQLLAYSGRGRLVVGAVDLSEVVREMADLLRTVVSKRARVVLDLARGLPDIEGDATQLRQLVMNLITNASDALGEHDGTITLRTRLAEHDEVDRADAVFGTLPDEQVLVALEVTDDGEGMDSTTMQRIFDPFFTTKFTGRGLGLSAAQGIVRGHRGVMALRSRPGAGTRFTIIMPASHRITPAEAVRVIAPTATTSRQGRLLVVDDDESVRAVLTRLLRARAFAVEAASNGQAALDLVRAQPTAYDAVLLDLTMPVMNGRETFEALAGIAPDLPVIMMSGYSEDDMGTSGARKPAAMLQKPFMPADVFVVLDRILARARPE